jgi:hypothetical protein
MSEAHVVVQCYGCSLNELDDTNLRVAPQPIEIECLPNELNRLITSYVDEENVPKWRKRDLTHGERRVIFLSSGAVRISVCHLIVLWILCMAIGLVARTQQAGQMRQRHDNSTAVEKLIAEFRPYPIINGSGWAFCWTEYDYTYPINQIVENAFRDFANNCVWDDTHGRLHGEWAVWIGLSGTFFIFLGWLYLYFRLKWWEYPCTETRWVQERFTEASIRPCTCRSDRTVNRD